jgi:hypothetical protein
MARRDDNIASSELAVASQARPLLLQVITHNGFFSSAKQKPIMNTITDAMANSLIVIFLFRQQLPYGYPKFTIQFRIMRLIWSTPAAVEQRDRGADTRSLLLAVLGNSRQRADRHVSVRSGDRFKIPRQRLFRCAVRHLLGVSPLPVPAC